MVLGIRKGSAASNSKLQVGDRIIAVAGEACGSSVSRVQAATRDCKGRLVLTIADLEPPPTVPPSPPSSAVRHDDDGDNGKPEAEPALATRTPHGLLVV